MNPKQATREKIAISETENREIDNVNETNSWSFKINKTDSQTDQEKERTQITNIRNERGDVTTDPKETKG